MKGSLSWALLVLMFAVSLVPANGLTVFHAHHDGDEDHVDHAAGLLGLSEASHARGSHHSEGLHAHQVGWSQMQKSSAQREIGAPVLVAQLWLLAPASMMSAQSLIRPVLQAAVFERTHAPPPLHRSMVFLI